MSFQEKSLWLMLISLTAGFGFYFMSALPFRTGDVMPHQVFVFGTAVALLVVISVVGHIAIAVVDRRTETDERDTLIALKGMRNGAYVLATGVFLSICVSLVIPGNFMFTHVLLTFWVLAHLVEISSQLFMHRRGA